MPPLATCDLDMICDATEQHWDLFRNQRLFITGGTGFFGHWLLESFLRANHRFALRASATVLTRQPAAFRSTCPHVADDPAITLLQGDARDFIFPDGEFSFVIHAAAVAETLEATRRTLDFASSHGCRRFLMISSGAVYGGQLGYGEGKRAAEALCAGYSMECAIARPFAFIGPHLPLDRGFAIGNFIRDALAAQPIVIRGDPETTRSYLYAADLAVWLWTMLARAVPLRPYNVGSDQPITMAKLAEEVAAAIRPGLPVLQAQDGPARSHYVPDVRRAAEELGLRQTTLLRDAIQKTAQWHGWSG